MKPRPAAVYREERQNEQGEFICSRMTYDEALFRSWLDGYKSYVRKYGHDNIVGPHRYVVGRIPEWEEA